MRPNRRNARGPDVRERSEAAEHDAPSVTRLTTRNEQHTAERSEQHTEEQDGRSDNKTHTTQTASRPDQGPLGSTRRGGEPLSYSAARGSNLSRLGVIASGYRRAGSGAAEHG